MEMRRIKVKVIPNAKKNEIVGEFDGVLKVKVTAPAQDGRANKELIDFLATQFGVSKSCVNIIKGDKGRFKLVEIVN